MAALQSFKPATLCWCILRTCGREAAPIYRDAPQGNLSGKDGLRALQPWSASTLEPETSESKESAMSHEKFQSCIEACHECMVACEHCATACLKEADVKMMARCIALDRSCADLCSLAEREMARGSPFAGRVCQLCAEACEQCAEECRRHKMDHCQKCADACQSCAEECRAMAGAGVEAM